jgi:hypothetical protein
MGYLIGGRIVNTDRYGKSKNINQNQGLIKVPEFQPIRGASLDKAQDFKARIRTQAADISRTAPTFNDPRYSFTTLSIPTDLRTLNGLYRFFDDTDPIVGNAIRLHTEFPLAGYGFSTCGDPGIQAHFEEMWDRIHGDQLLFDLGLEYWRIGNVFLFGAWNEVDFMWDQFAVLNPDYVTVDSTWLNQKPLIKLQPDEALKRIVSSGQPKFLYNQLSPEIIKYVRLGQEIPLDPNNTFFIAHNKAPYENLGKSIIKRILKMLIYEDRLNMANFSIATRQVIPITVVKLGDPASVEEDHFVTYLENDQLKIKTFKQMWDDYDGVVIFCGKGKEVKDVSKYNLKVISLKEDGTQVWNLIESILRYPTPDEIVEITTPLSTLRMTEGHSLVRINPNTLAFEHTTPKQLDERESPSIVSMDHYDYSVKADKVFGLPLTTDLAYLIGLWTADGNFNTWKKVEGRSVSNKDLIFSNSNENIGSYLINSFHKVARYVSDNDIKFVFEFPELAKALKDYYKVPYENGSCAKTGKEKVPQEILFNENKEIVGAFFAGVFDGDGWVNDWTLAVSCGSSKEYHHWLSLALLSQGILSYVRFRKSSSEKTTGVWECQISDLENRLKFYNLILSYLQHNKKKLYIENHLKPVNTHQDKTYTYDLGEKQREILFKNSSYRNVDGSLALTEIKNRKRISRNTIFKAGVACEAKVICQKLFGMSVTKIERKKKSSDYVYDLMLKDEPHTYLAAGDGWLTTYNSGWIPDQEEKEAVKEMLASREVDPNFTIMYHYGIDIQFYGASGKILNLTPEHDRIRKLKFLGLGISEALLSGGTATYATAYMNLEVLRQRYLHFQLRLENFVHKGLFEVVARLCGFYQTDKTVVGKNYKGKVYGDAKAMKNFMEQRFAQKTLRDLQDNFEFKEFIRKKAQEDAENGLAIRPKYIYPKMKWDLLSLTSDAQYRQFLMAFDKMFPGVRKISDSTYYRVLKLDGDLEQRQIEVEKQGQRDQQFKDAKKDKEFREKLISEGLELPPTQPEKTLGGGGLTLPGGPLPPTAPRAPIGKGVAEGEGKPGEKPGGGPEVLREKSKEMQAELEEGLEAETKRLKKSNEELLKTRDT